MKKLLLILLCVPLIGFSQSWKYSSGGDDFDGKYKTSSVKGSGDDYPYKNPSLVVNYWENSKQLNLYVDGSGYYPSESGTRAYFNFSNEKNVVYVCSDLSYSSDRKTVFMNEFYLRDNYDQKFEKLEIIEKLMNASYVNIRISNNYGKNTMKFSLNGSTKAIKFVVPDIDNRLELIKTRKKNEEAQKNKIKKHKNDIIASIQKSLQKYDFYNDDITKITSSLMKALSEDRWDLTDTLFIKNIKSILDINILKNLDSYDIEFGFNELQKRGKIFVSIEYVDFNDKKHIYKIIRTLDCFSNFLSNRVSDNCINKIPTTIIIEEINYPENKKTLLEMKFNSDYIYYKESIGDEKKYSLFNSVKNQNSGIVIEINDFLKWDKKWDLDNKRKKEITNSYPKSSLDYFVNKTYESFNDDESLINLELKNIVVNQVIIPVISYQKQIEISNKNIHYNIHFRKGNDYFYMITTMNELNDSKNYELLQSIAKSFTETTKLMYDYKIK